MNKNSVCNSRILCEYNIILFFLSIEKKYYIEENFVTTYNKRKSGAENPIQPREILTKSKPHATKL